MSEQPQSLAERAISAAIGSWQCVHMGEEMPPRTEFIQAFANVVGHDEATRMDGNFEKDHETMRLVLQLGGRIYTLMESRNTQ